MWFDVQTIVLFIQRCISMIGVLIIISGIVLAAAQYLYYVVSGKMFSHGEKINRIRLNLGRILILGLEFIVAADLINTTTAPDYYTVGLLVIIVIIRTLLSFSINRELMSLSKEK